MCAARSSGSLVSVPRNMYPIDTVSMAWDDSAPTFAWGRLAPLPITHARRQDPKGTCPHASRLSLSSVVGPRGSLALRSGASTLASSTASSKIMYIGIVSCGAGGLARWAWSSPGRRPYSWLASRKNLCESAVLRIAPSGICGSACWYDATHGSRELNLWSRGRVPALRAVLGIPFHP